MNRQQAALRIRSGLVKHFRETSDRFSLQAALGDYASILELREDLKSALPLYREQELLAASCWHPRRENRILNLAREK